ncbi:TPA: hypothetical protein DDZ06_00425 [Candidatus Uhrbacteria bacterium]|uniref:Polymorphic membrane protein n=2 Tax=Candidatus Uhriibacteriota TaxID=1752732 RepID=A0A0G1Q9L3_9BACT|nr:MAG: Polymorphic membrane protein [Candidatus Uhrbacteria bacterium GW2011_GWF2_46_218]KKU41659.1 MAG: Polymorphic membrane protein [Candidatus Uhrbacteria bacterium GW2011_GWE2_46_68]HBK33471.1 hypothetical protein [Candidatus Uhrbacteria bacterium]
MELTKEEPPQRGSSFVAYRCGRAVGIPGFIHLTFSCMQRWKNFSHWVMGFFLCGILFAPSAQAATPATVFISEIAWAGSSLSASDEWIELANPTDATIDLSGYELLGAASSGSVITLPEGSLITPYSTFLIANYDIAHENAVVSTVPSYITSSISLSNSALQITFSNAQGEILDVAGDGSVPLAGNSGGTSLGGPYASMERVYPLLDGTFPDAWTATTAQTGIKEGINDLGTPGFYSFETTTIVEETSDTPVQEESVLTETESTTTEEVVEDIEETIVEQEIVLPSLFISEFVSDPSEGAFEFIELYNNTDLPLDLTGYTIADAAGKITTLEGTIAAQSYYLVSEPAGKLNNDGDTIILTDPSGTIVETVIFGTDDLPALSDPSAYARTQEGTLVTTTTPTPGQENIFTTEIITENTSEETVSPSLFISEFVSDPSEDAFEFVELYNNSDVPLDLTGYTLADAAGKITTLEGTMAAQSYYLISEPAGKLNNDEDTIILSNASGTIIETIMYGTDDLPALSDPSAYAHTQEGTLIATTTPTPGQENIFTTELPEVTIEEESVEEKTITETENIEDVTSVLSYQSGDLLLNELVSSPLEGEVEWVEIYHPGTNEIALTHWTLEDATGKQTNLGEGTLAPKSYLIVPSPKGVLNNDGDTLILKDGQGNVIDTLIYGAAEIPAPKKGYALAKTAEGTWKETETVTPGMVNTISTAEETTTDTTSSGVSETQEETNVSYDYTALRLSEIYPNTNGSDEVEEFIEIENVGDSPVDLFGVILEDASGKQFIFSTHQNLSNVSVMALMREVTALALNNLGDTVSLYDPSYKLLDQVTYEKTNQGQSLARIHGSWDWTSHPTANEPNAFPTTQVDKPSSVTTTNTIVSAGEKTTTTLAVDRPNTSSGYLVTMDQVRTLADDTPVQVTGIVSVVPGILGKQIFYIQDETSGIQIYQYNADFPVLQEGDEVTVKGVMSTSREERRIKISEQQDIVVQKNPSNLEAASMTLTEISTEKTGILITVSGIVVSKENSSILLEEDGIQLTVRLASVTGLTPANFSTGAHMAVTGILTKSNDQLVLLPRFAEDIKILVSTTEDTTMTGLIAQEQTSKRIALVLTTAALVILAGFALSYFAPRIKSYVTHRPLRLGTQETH